MKHRMILSVWMLTLMLLASCDVFEVMDDMYVIADEQGRVTLQVAYSEYSEDMAGSLPGSYLLKWKNKTEFSNGTLAFRSLKDDSRYTSRMDHSLDTLVFDSYVQPGSYRFYTYNTAAGFSVNASTAAVKAEDGVIVRNPGTLFLGAWNQEITKGERVNANVMVRQRTRPITFTIELDMSDSLSYVSSEVSLSHVFTQIDMTTGTLDPSAQVTLPLQMSAEPYKEDGRNRVRLEDKINVLSPSAAEYAEWGVNNTLTVIVRYMSPSGEQQAEFVIDNALDEAYSSSYVASTQDDYCVMAFRWTKEVAL